MCLGTSFLSHRFTQMKHKLRDSSRGTGGRTPALPSMCVDLCSSVANQIPLNLDHAFKNELGWACQGHVLKLHSDFLKPHLKFVSTAHKYIDGPAHVFGRGKNERARYHTGAARKRLVFNTSLVGAHCNFSWSAFLDEF